MHANSTKYTLPIAAFVTLCFTGCLETLRPPASSLPPGKLYKSEMETIQARGALRQAFYKSRGSEAWYEQRQKLILATGDRDYGGNFARVFDSCVVAVASLGMKVEQMERASGYMSAKGLELSPAEEAALEEEAFRQWVVESGRDPAPLDTPVESPTAKAMLASYETNWSSTFLGYGRAVTVQVVKLDEDNTRVKLRFANVDYPGRLARYYEALWQAIDKQLFVDSNIEGRSVESRQ